MERQGDVGRRREGLGHGVAAEKRTASLLFRGVGGPS